MKNIALSLFRTNLDISDFIKNSTNLGDIADRRSKIKIAVIDDAPFTPQVNLQNYGYKFDLVGDIKKIDEVQKYQLILCDIKGVGAYLGGSNEGAAIISELKSRFPEKIVIAYSASKIADTAVRAAKERADAFIAKDVDIEEWISELDKWSIEALDPAKIWLRIRKRFIELDVDTKQILLLEDAFVRSVISGDVDVKELAKNTRNINIPSDARAIIQGLVSSAIFKILVG
jgi:CheY-like chemotaxis protein